MRKIILVRLIMFLMILSPSVFAFPTLTGKELLNYCEVSLDIHDNNMGRVQIESDFLQGAKAGFCEGYLRGIDEAHGKKCLPENNERLANIAIIVKYLKDHPQQLDSPASYLVLKAYQYYFHC